MFLGLRSLIYPTPDIDAAKAWYSAVLGVEPYFDEPAYVGFSVGGFELGLFAAGNPADGPKTYWGVADVDAALTHLLGSGATLDEPVEEVGGGDVGSEASNSDSGFASGETNGIRMAAVRDPAGMVFGIIENPLFEAREVSSPGPGR